MVAHTQGASGEQPIQFGFTTNGMKASLFSRMSPNGKAGGQSNFSELHKAAKTQASSNNIGKPASFTTTGTQ